MVYREPTELVQVKDLIDQGKFEEAFKILSEFAKKKALSLEEKLSHHILMSRLLGRQWLFNESRKFAKTAYQLSYELGHSYRLIDVYLEMIMISNYDSKLEEALDFIDKAENLLKTFNNKPRKERTKIKADLLWHKALTYYNMGEKNKALKYAEQALGLRKELNSNIDIVLSLQQLGSFYTMIGEFNFGLEYIEQGLKLSKKINYKQLIPALYNCYGISYAYKGELDQALKYYEKGLVLAKKLKMNHLISSIMNNIGMVYQEKGCLDDAQELLEKSLEISEDTACGECNILDSLFHLSIENGDFEAASIYLQRLSAYKDKSVNANVIYRTDKAVMLKTSSRARNRVKAEEIFKQVIEEKHTNYEMRMIALINLCDLLIIELNNTYDLEILDEIAPYITQLLNITEKNHSYSLLTETYVLQAKLALLTSDFKETRRLLTKAQEIAEKYGLNRLAIKISNEHDEFLKQLANWENLNKLEVPLKKRLEIAGVNEQMGNILMKRALEPSDLSDEDPVVLLIISEGGRPLYSESFTKEWSFQDYLFGGFLTAMHTFSDEMFSEGLERAKFGEYNLIMRSVPPFLVCYLFKGKSYLAQQRLSYFVNELQSDQKAWETFRDFYQRNREIQAKDIPSLEPLVKDIFINKAVPLNV
ncbi:MAG: tetratricopeptide repeat protein [Promethearchaeota archaeon]|nr:MAG: tetratricopeptide repeat protein [Candidatus Lokiarchaeota archaeon]